MCVVDARMVGGPGRGDQHSPPLAGRAELDLQSTPGRCRGTIRRVFGQSDLRFEGKQWKLRRQWAAGISRGQPGCNQVAVGRARVAAQPANLGPQGVQLRRNGGGGITGLGTGDDRFCLLEPPQRDQGWSHGQQQV